jgi:hypothetical protein
MFDKILSFLNFSPAALSTAGVVLEMVLRLIPSEKPMGILQGLAAVLKRLADLSDKVLPQNLSEK